MNITKYILFSFFMLGLLFLFGCKEHPVIDNVRNGNLSAVDEYLKNNGDPNRRNSVGESLLMLAAYYHHPAIVEDLIKAGADVNAKNDYYTVLEFAFFQDSPDVDTIELLLEAGANIPDEALRYAIRSRNSEIVKLFLQKGADISVREWSPLVVACRDGGYDIIQLLLKAGADVNAKDKFGDTALMEAGNLRNIKLLLEAGANNVNAKNSKGETALMKAIDHIRDYELPKEWIIDEMEAIKLLLKAGADVNAANEDGWTALMKASWYGRTEIVKLLLKVGADVNAKDVDGDTAIRIARRKGHADVVKILKTAGAQSL